jgi:hypothetical protein
MIRKIFGILALLLVIGIIPGVFADDQNTIDANTLEEVKILATPHGAEVRLLQLEKSLTRNILVGAKTIEILKQNPPEFDLNEAENTLDELEALLVEVKNYVFKEKDANTIVTDYVAMKKEAITLTQEFREKTREILTSEDIQTIHEEVKELELNELNAIREKTINTIRQHNAERTQTMLKILGINDEDFIQGIMDGNITKLQVRDRMHQEFNDRNIQERKRINAEIKEQTNKRIISEKALIQQAKNRGIEKFLQIESQRMQRLSNWLETRASDLNASGYQQRAERIQGLSDKLAQNSEKVQGIANQVRKKGE